MVDRSKPSKLSHKKAPLLQGSSPSQSSKSGTPFIAPKAKEVSCFVGRTSADPGQAARTPYAEIHRRQPIAWKKEPPQLNRSAAKPNKNKNLSFSAKNNALDVNKVPSDLSFAQKSNERHSVDKMTEVGCELDPANVATPQSMLNLPASDHQEVSPFKLGTNQTLRKASEGQQTLAFERRSALLQKSLERVRPELYKQRVSDDSDDMLVGQEDSHLHSLETLVTQIGVEETNIKTIGVSGLRHKGPSGSLTERQSHLRQVEGLGQAQLETHTEGPGPSVNLRLDRSQRPPINRAESLQPQSKMEKDVSLMAVRHRHTQMESWERVLARRVLAQRDQSQDQLKSLLLMGKDLNDNELSIRLREQSKLNKIDVQGNKLTLVPYPELVNFSQTLTVLCFDDNKLRSISEEALRQVPQLKLLRLSNNQLTHLPDSLFSLSALTLLDVSFNMLSSFSPKVSLLRQLRSLNIAENQLEGLPNSIGYLENLEAVSSEFFIYLPDQHHCSNNVQTDCDLERDRLSLIQLKTTMLKSGTDGRFQKLTSFMRLQIAVMTTFFDLLQEFTHPEERKSSQGEADYEHRHYSKPANLFDESPKITDEHDVKLGVKCKPGAIHLEEMRQSSAPIGLSERLSTHDKLMLYEQYLPSKEFRTALTVFQTLNPDAAKGQTTLLHRLVENKHNNLLKQFASALKKHVSTVHIYLQAKADQDSKKQYQGLMHSWPSLFQDIISTAVNQANDRGFSPLDTALASKQADSAEVFATLFAKYIELSCGQPSQTPQSEIRVIVPGNLQSGPVAEKNKQAERAKLHPILVTLTTGKFQLTGKLIDIALDCQLKRNAQLKARCQMDYQLTEPDGMTESLKNAKEPTKQLFAALRSAESLQTVNGGHFSLNFCDKEAGMTLLHHLFSNFELGPEKAASLFRKMNALHLRNQNRTEQRRTSGEATPIAQPRLFGCRASPQIEVRSKLKSEQVLCLDDTIAFRLGSTLKQQASQKQAIFQVQLGAPPSQRDPMDHPLLTGAEVEPLELNTLNHFFETPLDIAIEHFQNSAVFFSLNWNYSHVQTIREELLKKTQKFGGARSRSSSYCNGDMFFGKPRLPTERDFFNVMCQENPRRYTPLHRAVIAGNFTAIKILFESELFKKAHLVEPLLSQVLRKTTLIDIHALDKYGKSARDYSHKIVFMSKLLYQAYTKQVWARANLHAVKAELRKQKQETGDNKQQRNSVMATYDKLISHTTRFRQRSQCLTQQNLKVNQIYGEGLQSSNFVVQHTRLNTVFMRRCEQSSAIAQEVRSQIGLSLQKLQQARGGPNSTRSHDKRLIKSFAPALHTTPQHKVLTPYSPHKSKLRSDEPLKFGPEEQVQNRLSAKQSSVQPSTKGIKKAKSMAFNNLGHRLDPEAQARQFLSKAAQLKHKKTSVKKPPLPFDADGAPSQETQPLDMKELSSQSQLDPQGIYASQSSVMNASSKFQGTASVESHFAKTQISGHTDKEQNSTQRLQVSADQITLIKSQQLRDELSAIEKAQIQVGLRQKLGAVEKETPCKFRGAETQGQKLFQSFLAMSKPVNVTTNGPSIKGFLQFVKPDTDSDVLKLADLEMADSMLMKQQQSIELNTHDFNDSCSADSFTPLPSIQNDYALEIKSFYKHGKKPYSQQLATNCFKAQFELIMNYQCDLERAFLDEDISKERFKFHHELRAAAKSKPLMPHEKLKLLYEIVRQARHPEKLQDAKDVLDFILYEIGSSLQGSRNGSRNLHQPKMPQGDTALKCMLEDDKTSQNVPDQSSQRGRRQQAAKTAREVQAQLRAKLEATLNESNLFLKQEVNNLRCQLDFVAKQMLAFHTEDPSAASESEDTRSVGDEKMSTTHVQTTLAVEDQKESSDKHNLTSSHWLQLEQVQSCRNPALHQLISFQGGTEEPTSSEQADVTELTEADIDVDDFDENLNTPKDPPQKRAGPTREAIFNKTMMASSRGDSGMTRMLKRQGKQKKVFATQKRLKKLDERSRENLETDEGLMLINQPLVSSELLSFSDRLSNKRPSATSTSQSQPKTQSDKTQYELSFAEAKTNSQRLKYAAFAQIDLSTFNFPNKKSSGSLQQQEPIVEKSKTVVDIPKILASSRRNEDKLRVLTSLTSSASDERTCRVSQKRSAEILHQEGTLKDQFVVIEEEKSAHRESGKQHKTLHSQRSGSFKQLPSSARSINTSHAKKSSKHWSGKKPVQNLGTLTSQKMSLRVLHEYQSLRQQQKQTTTPVLKNESAGKLNASTQPPKPVSKLSHLNQLSTSEIYLPTSSKKSTPNAQPTLSDRLVHLNKSNPTEGMSKAKEDFKGKIAPARSNPQTGTVKATYVQPKVHRIEKAKTFKQTARQQSRNAIQTVQSQAHLSAVSVCSMKTLEGPPVQLHARQPHRLLKHLIEHSSSRSRQMNFTK